MPAVTADTLTLPRLPEPAIDAIDRPVRSVTTAPKGFEGEGFPVRRAFAGVDIADLDPFIHMDQMGEVDYAPGEPRGTDWHPHRGFETVTYMIDGTFQHQDSHGGGGVITNGATQWMTAGGGILHIETPPEELVISGGLFHGIQLWVNLPARDKMVAPRYQNLEADQVTLLVVARRRRAGAPHRRRRRRLPRPRLDAHADHRRPRHGGPGRPARAAVAAGVQRARPTCSPAPARSGAEARPVDAGQLVVFGAGDTVTLRGDAEQPLDVLLLGGQPIREPVAAYGPFVMNTRDELVQAVEDFQAGRLGTVPRRRPAPVPPCLTVSLVGPAVLLARLAGCARSARLPWRPSPRPGL